MAKYISEIKRTLKKFSPFYKGGTYAYFDCNKIERLVNENQRLKSKIDNVVESIEHELYGHILPKDEISWSQEFYTNGRLDYRKLLIDFLEKYLKELK